LIVITGIYYLRAPIISRKQPLLLEVKMQFRKHIIQNICYLFCLFGLILLFGFTSGGVNNGKDKKGETKRDTVSAIVIYGDELLLDSSLIDFDDKKILAFRDSMCGLAGTPIELVNQIDFYLNLRSLEDEEIFTLIDSLFDANEVPYALINQINLYLTNRPAFDAVPSHLYVGGEDTATYPAQSLYNGWNTLTPNPYSEQLSRNDTTLYLLLQGTEKLGQFHLPVDNVITSKFGWRDGRNHNGIDIDLEVWDPVVSAFPGMVRVARYYGGYGRVVVVRHFNGLETVYAHLHRLKVKPGQIVQGGEVIGLGGSSGHSTGSHLHFECRFKGKPVNPMNFISFEDKTLVNDTLILKKTKYGYAAFPEGVQIHMVKRGDCLFDIAKQYGTSANRLCELNGIRRNSVLVVGQRIRVI